MERVLLLLTLLPAAWAEGVYELAEDNSCTVVAREAENVDILCALPVNGCKNQTSATITWIFSSRRYRKEIKETNEEYGVWNELKFDNNQLTSLLRVRDIDKDEDAGTYTCSLTCEVGSEPTLSRAMEICIRDATTGLIACDLSTTDPICTHVFGDGFCNEQCDAEDQLFDGGDCDSYRDEVCTAPDCTALAGNSVCDINCSSSQCGFDGGDCLQTPQSITVELLAIVIPSSFHTDVYVTHLSRQLSSMLSTLVELHGTVSRWSATDSKSIQTTYLNPASFKLAENNLTMLQFKLTPQSCVSDRMCFLRVRSAAKYISHHLIIDSSAINSSIASVGVDGEVDECKRREESESPNFGEINTDSKESETLYINSKKKVKLMPAEIVGLALCGFSLLLLVMGILIACRYRVIAKKRQRYEASKQCSMKPCMDSLPANGDLSSEESSNSASPKSPLSSIGRSVTSKETILLRNVSNTPHNHLIYDTINTSQA
ncbi:neurogenic locus notch homolog protein 1-like [Watersipora subatra]|uniref:neurogenic locus notch homolog protein 1-like n=1 Tax=Watersipora subatra TaxID=2589382 RepID=UPI00355B4CE0